MAKRTGLQRKYDLLVEGFLRNETTAAAEHVVTTPGSDNYGFQVDMSASSAATGVAIIAAAAATAPQIRAISSGTNEGLAITSKGTGSVTIWTGNAAREVLICVNTASAVNELTITPAATTANPRLAATGDDTNIGLDLSSKGTGSVTLWTGNAAREALICVNTASAVNEVTITPAATTAAPAISATGDDTNIGLGISSKGTGSITFWAGASARELLVLANAATAVNQLQITPSATTAAVLVAATGDDTNVGLSIDGKGSGVITLNGTGTGNITTPRALLSTGATAGIGYNTGAGGTVTQATSKSTGATLNTVTGNITMNGAALAADTTVTFTLTNSAVATEDAVIVLHDSVGTMGAYSFGSNPAAGSVDISVHNNTPGSLSEAIVLKFVVIKGVVA